MPGSMNFFCVHVLPASKVWLTCPLLFTSQPFFSSKNQMSSVLEVAVGEFVATQFQSFAVLIGLIPLQIFLGFARNEVWAPCGANFKKDLGKQRQHPSQNMV